MTNFIELVHLIILSIFCGLNIIGAKENNCETLSTI